MTVECPNCEARFVSFEFLTMQGSRQYRCPECDRTHHVEAWRVEPPGGADGISDGGGTDSTSSGGGATA